MLDSRMVSYYLVYIFIYSMIVNVVISLCIAINNQIILKSMNEYAYTQKVEHLVFHMASLHQMHMYHFCILYCMAMFLDLKKKRKKIINNFNIIHKNNIYNHLKQVSKLKIKQSTILIKNKTLCTSRFIINNFNINVSIALCILVHENKKSMKEIL